jgi:hypothetical protein
MSKPPRRSSSLLFSAGLLANRFFDGLLANGLSHGLFGNFAADGLAYGLLGNFAPDGFFDSLFGNFAADGLFDGRLRNFATDRFFDSAPNGFFNRRRHLFVVGVFWLQESLLALSGAIGNVRTSTQWRRLWLHLILHQEFMQDLCFARVRKRDPAGELQTPIFAPGLTAALY